MSCETGSFLYERIAGKYKCSYPHLYISFDLGKHLPGVAYNGTPTAAARSANAHPKMRLDEALRIRKLLPKSVLAEDAGRLGVLG